MLRNYFITAIRVLLREKTNTFINIAGLSLGITGSLILFLILQEGGSVDTYHSRFERIGRVVTTWKGNSGDNFSSGVPVALPEAFKNDFPDVEEVAFTSYRAGSVIGIPADNGEVKKYKEEKGVVFTEPSFFRIFDREVLIGSAEEGLDEPNEAIISASAALKYFGKTDAIGHVIKHDKVDYKVTAVMADAPHNTDLPFEVMLSYATIRPPAGQSGWDGIWNDEHCYFLLKEGVSLSSLQEGMAAFSKKHLGEGDVNQNESAFIVQPLAQVHKDGRFGNYSRKVSSDGNNIALTVVAVFLLITASINFINLTTAEAVKRTREVGIRKALGSSRFQLITKFTGETLLVTSIASVISLGLSQVFIGFVNPFMETSLALNLTSDYSVWIFIVVVTFVVSLLSGVYPAFTVSAFKPVQALKSRMANKGSSGFSMRKGLVVAQFFISQFFIIGTITIIRQTEFLQQQDLGFTQDAVINIPIPEPEEPGMNDGVSKMRSLKNELTLVAGVESVSLSSAPPSSRGTRSASFKIEGSEDELETQIKEVDGDFISFYDLDLIAGEALADLDTMNGFVVNEKFVAQSGFVSNMDILGKQVDFWGKKYPVKGVVKNYHTTSLTQAIEPVIMLNNISGFSTISVKLNQADMQSTIAAVQKKWEASYPAHMFEYKFLDEQIKGFYDGQRKASTMISIFAFVAIFIGCLGLFGLATFMANQRTKEIGVRKVLGATVGNIVVLFTKEFAKLIMLGFVLAAPAAYFLTTSYLQKFAYKIEVGPAMFITGLSITFLIAIITVGYRSFSAAAANPVNSLRSE